MSKQNDEFDQDEAFVSEAYKRINKEQASDAIDKAILDSARTKLVNKRQRKPSKLLWSKWQYGSSVAASMIFVAFIYGLSSDFTSQEHLPMPDEQFRELNRNQDKIKPDFAKAPELNENIDMPQPYSRSEASNGNESDSETAIKNESRAQEQLTAQAQKQEQLAAREIKMRKQEQDQISNSQRAMEPIAVTGMRLRSEEKNSDLLSQLYRELQTLQKELALSFEQIMQVEQAKDEAGNQALKEFKSTQAAFFESLKQEKLAAKDWQLSSSYRKFLTESQIEQLMRNEGND